MKNIHISQLFCPTPRTEYSIALIDQLAQSIDSTGGLLRPLIVQQLVVDEHEDTQFEVVDGFIFYWAAVHAEENNITLSHVPCWVIGIFSDIEAPLQQLEYVNSIGWCMDIDDFESISLTGAQ